VVAIRADFSVTLARHGGPAWRVDAVLGDLVASAWRGTSVG
jgi:hypothetical protein